MLDCLRAVVLSLVALPFSFHSSARQKSRPAIQEDSKGTAVFVLCVCIRDPLFGSCWNGVTDQMSDENVARSSVSELASLEGTQKKLEMIKSQ